MYHMDWWRKSNSWLFDVHFYVLRTMIIDTTLLELKYEKFKIKLPRTCCEKSSFALRAANLRHIHAISCSQAMAILGIL